MIVERIANPEATEDTEDSGGVYEWDSHEGNDLGCGVRAFGDHGGECAPAGAIEGAGERLAGVPLFVRQIFYVHWVYILIVLGLFAALCFGFAAELAGGNALGRFLSGFMAGFWLLRIVLQIFYYDREIRRENRGLDSMYLASLIVLVVVFGAAVVRVV